jgi:hypothetical protein
MGYPWTLAENGLFRSHRLPSPIVMFFVSAKIRELQKKRIGMHPRYGPFQKISNAATGTIRAPPVPYRRTINTKAGDMNCIGNSSSSKRIAM